MNIKGAGGWGSWGGRRKDGKVLLVGNALPFLTYNVILSLAIEGCWE